MSSAVGRACRSAYCFVRAGAPQLVARHMSSSAGGSSPSGGAASTTYTAAATHGAYSFESLAVTSPKPFVLLVKLNRPAKSNAMHAAMWREVRQCFEQAADDSDVRSVVLAARGKTFCAGIDVLDMVSNGQGLLDTSLELMRRAKLLEKFIGSYQDTFTAIEKCPKPVIAAVHGACIGGGVDMITACDIRYASADAYFQIKEVDLGLAADVGTLQRLPKVVGNDSFVREAAYTARKVSAPEALSVGLVSRILQDYESLLSAAVDMASLIATKSPVAVQGTKLSLNYSRDHTVEEGLNHIKQYNKFALQSEDLMKAAQAAMQRSGEPPVFSKL